MASSLSPSLSFRSMDGLDISGHESNLPAQDAKQLLLDLVDSIQQDELKHAITKELKRIFANHERLLNMLQSRSEALEQENRDYKTLANDHQHRYEKAVREMQFFRKKYEGARDMNKQYVTSAITTPPATEPPPPPPQHPLDYRSRSLSIESGSSGEGADQQTSTNSHQQQSAHRKGSVTFINSYPLTPTSPQPSAIPNDLSIFGKFDPDFAPSLRPIPRNSTTVWHPPPGNPGSIVYQAHIPISPSTPERVVPATVALPPPPSRLRQNSTCASIHSAQSSGTDSSSGDNSNNTTVNTRDKSSRKQSWQLLQQPSTPTIADPSPKENGPTAAPLHSVPMTPVRSSTATNGYTGASMIQQRRVDPLIFGGSDALWDTISKSKGSDVTVEKIISNFLRRGGSPNTAKQSPTSNAVKFGFGMIHALIVTKAPGALDLLLQQGANPNVFSLAQIDDDRVTPCYMAASVGWLAGLQKLVQAGGDLLAARGCGAKNKTALHVAAEHCHAAVVEYIVEATEGRLNLEVDSLGATVLHYACASGHTDLVSFLAKSCELPVNQEDYRGELPLHWAARHGRLEVVTLLVERCGCDCNTYTPRKVGTPLDLARAGGHRRLVDYLKGLGAMSSKKMEKRREEEMAKEVPVHLESTLTRNGLFGMGDDEF